MANHLVLRCVLVGGTSWKEVRHAGTGNPSIGCILLCGFGPAWCSSTPPCCSGSKQKPSWACGTGLAVRGCSMWHADANLELRLGVHAFGWLQVRGVGTLDGANHPRIKSTPEVGCCARFTGWTPSYGHERGSAAPAVQSGQMVKSYQSLAMTVGAACLLLKFSSSAM